MTLASIAALLAAYLLGSIPTGVLVVRAVTGRDVRRVGSGRTGGTNVLRAAGTWATALTVLGDGAKGLAAVCLARALVDVPLVEALAGLLAVVGHNYSVFIGFTGGAGTATTIGGAIGLWPWSGLILVAVGGPLIALTRYASMASIVVALALPILFAVRTWLTNAPGAYLVHGLGTMALTLWALRPNIRRLVRGRERRVNLTRQAGDAPPA